MLRSIACRSQTNEELLCDSLPELKKTAGAIYKAYENIPQDRNNTFLFTKGLNFNSDGRLTTLYDNPYYCEMDRIYQTAIVNFFSKLLPLEEIGPSDLWMNVVKIHYYNVFSHYKEPNSRTTLASEAFENDDYVIDLDCVEDRRSIDFEGECSIAQEEAAATALIIRLAQFCKVVPELNNLPDTSRLSPDTINILNNNALQLLNQFDELTAAIDAAAASTVEHVEAAAKNFFTSANIFSADISYFVAPSLLPGKIRTTPLKTVKALDTFTPEVQIASPRGISSVLGKRSSGTLNDDSPQALKKTNTAEDDEAMDITTDFKPRYEMSAYTNWI